MCGVVGYIGYRQAQETLLQSLVRLEYRGYDSCGIAVVDGDLKVFKDAVRVADLAAKAQPLNGTFGIGHTRWATCGEPNQANAHPHQDCTHTIAVVHNGTINNHVPLRSRLKSQGHVFTSDTDTEVIAHLIENHYHGDLASAVRSALAEIEGSYAVAVVHHHEQDKLVVARKGSPLIIGLGQGENWVASDVPAILGYTNRVVYMEENELAVVTRDGIKLWHGDNEKIPEIKHVEWTAEQAHKGGYDHFMIKEIHEQPRIIRESNSTSIHSGVKDAELSGILSLDPPPSILILACGTSYHAGLIAKYLVEELLGLSVNVELASEFNYHRHRTPEALAIVITQSGETADALLAMRRLREHGTKLLAITNVPGCTASRLADETWYTGAGPEISVAATKSFTAQLKVIYRLLLSCSRLERRDFDRLTLALRLLPSAIQGVLDNQLEIRSCAKYLASCSGVIFIGRGLNYPIALEGALKLKEVAYIPSQGYAAGELKHGPLALVSKTTPVVAVLGRDTTHDAMLTTLREIKVRGAPLIAIAPKGDDGLDGLADYIIPRPEVDNLVSPMLNAVVLQLLAYYTALELGCPIDMPRNLAKSVTVE
ncbi:glutamine--fructose-6-phosphate transaminase (isomerizing) [Dehalogenimonas formicexedens]|uniref:Glutamine--fructose-6-phosphate aminotransferase [isomerizing] n=1 Tax=Dehalogenimonas formicexedens TaxID=1839801 RepID=A0A1P8F9J7_9CHLR|nr:glutamine--fructose-6-phosphate transaminase (isomerizing) [Dehalogenimonas formicexedens]APV45136.1 glutamine--fructose-6-phosphate transaminase (isomerizing) [Dehalogenimonas formicexedens]